MQSYGVVAYAGLILGNNCLFSCILGLNSKDSEFFPLNRLNCEHVGSLFFSGGVDSFTEERI